MILNAYSVLALFVGAIELALGVGVAVLATRALRRRRASPARAAGDAPEASSALLPLAAGSLLVVAVASWPLLYLLLASYVPQWRDVMCIQGVARVGTGSVGLSGWLPTLVQALQATKPLLAFAAGAWLLLHLVDRRTRTAPLFGRVLLALALAGGVAALDAAIGLAYVAAPKQEQTLSVGCCLVAGSEGAGGGALRAGVLGGGPRSKGALTAVFYGTTLALAAWTALVGRAARRGDEVPRRAAGPLFLGALAALPVGVLFLREVAAPAFLGRPDHACAYCLLGESPLGVLAILLFWAGALATAWACVAARAADVPETRGFLPRTVASVVRGASFGWAGSAVLTAAQVLVA
jgi:hypothetical protein